MEALRRRQPVRARALAHRNHASDRGSPVPSAFTLIELLVVVSTISLLAALLLPALNRTKAGARSTACKNNLRQTGLALGVYLTDFEKYPTVDSDPYRILVPYCGGCTNVVACPAVPASEIWAWLYGCNDDGTGVLGLGGLDPAHQRPVPESLVLVPCDMLAYGDGVFGWPAGFGYPGFYWSGLHGDHLVNAVFCDAHVESSRSDLLPHRMLETAPWGPRPYGAFIPDSALARRWNRDNQPHPETWPQQ